MFPNGEDVSYVIVRDPDNRVSCVAPNLDYSINHIEEVLDELVFSKNKDNNKDEN